MASRGGGVCGGGNETLISQSMQLSEDEEDDGVAGAHETSISYLTKENQMIQNSTRKFNSTFTRKTQHHNTNHSSTHPPNPISSQPTNEKPNRPAASQLDQFNQISNKLSLAKKQGFGMMAKKVLQTEQARKELINSLEIDAQDSQILEESGVEPNKIKVASFNMFQPPAQQPSIISRLHKKQASAPQLPFSNTGSV